MGEVIIRVQHPEVRAELADRLPAEIPTESDVVVTDRVPVAARVSVPVAFVGLGLPVMIKVMCDLDVEGILRRDEIDVGQLTSIASGTRVYSKFAASNLGLDETDWKMVALAAHGVSPENASEMIAYSGRQIRRHLDQLMTQARLTGDCSWTVLSPLFRRLSETDSK